MGCLTACAGLHKDGARAWAVTRFVVVVVRMYRGSVNADMHAFSSARYVALLLCLLPMRLIDWLSVVNIDWLSVVNLHVH